MHSAGAAGPDVSVAAAGEVSPSPVNSLLSTVQSARYVPLGSTTSGAAQVRADVQERAEAAAPKGGAAAASTGAKAGETATARRSTTPATVPPRTATGDASWYQAAPGTCAHPTLPFGTVVTIVDVANGHTGTCSVDDRGPYEGGRIIDLSYDVFEQLAPAGLGIIDVRLSW